MIEKYNFSKKLSMDYSLNSKHLFKKSAGNAKYYYQLQFDETLDNDLRELSRFSKENKIPFRIFGMHTNIYITDNGYDGIFVDLTPANSKIEFNAENETFVVSGNLLVSKLVNYTMNMGYEDKDVVKLFMHTIDKLKKLYNVTPIKEVLILDYDGEIDLDTFIERNK